jgi:penicillin amidase
VRVIVRALLALAAIVVAVALAAYGTLRASLPDVDGERTVVGIKGPVTVERDALGVVTINATTRTDAAYALGYVHGQDRYFQMDLARRMSGGRLAELFGDIALDTDRRNRRHRFDDVADRVLESLPAQQRAALVSYAAGVNAGLTGLRSRPFEYWLLRAKPQPWTAHDCLLVVFAMYLQLNDEDASLDRERGLIAAALPGPMVDFIYSFAPEAEAPVDGLVAAAPPPPAALEYDLRKRTTAASRSARAHATFASRGIGSNNWALAGSRTASGAAIVANDMHLGLGIPNSWYRVRMHFANGSQPDLAGVTLPGAPNLVVGSNGHIAWGFTNSYGDYSDLVLVETSTDGRSYRTATGWRPLRHDAETLRSSSGRTETLDVVSTEWGPLLDHDFRGRRVALAWTAQRPEATNLRWLDLERALSVQEALALAPTTADRCRTRRRRPRRTHRLTLLGRIRAAARTTTRAFPRLDPPTPGGGVLAGENTRASSIRLTGSSEREQPRGRRVCTALIGDGSPDRARVRDPR